MKLTTTLTVYALRHLQMHLWRDVGVHGLEMFRKGQRGHRAADNQA